MGPIVWTLSSTDVSNCSMYPVNLACWVIWHTFLSSADFFQSYYTPRKLCLWWVYCFHVRPCVRPSVTFCFLNILKSYCWIFIKPCKHVYICKTNTLDKKVVIPPRKLCLWWVYCFHVVRPCVRASMRASVRNVLFS